MILDSHIWTDKNFTWTFELINGSPIIITVPHDRTIHPSDLEKIFDSRKNEIRGADKHVWPIAKDVLLQAKVNAIRGLMPRHFIDYNRNEQLAFEDKRLKSAYDAYHKAIGDLLSKSKKKYGKCLLLDLHGFIRQPKYGEFDLILGTRNRKTINSRMDISLAQFMEKSGYNIFLPQETTVIPNKPDEYSGQFTVAHYAKKLGIDAIQIEIAKKFRTQEGVCLGRKLANDIARFITSSLIDIN